MKTCFKCQRVQPLEAFYRHPMMADGHLGKCKECTRRDVRLNRERRAKHYREYDKRRGGRPVRRSRLKRVAEYTAKNAIARGKVVRPERCSYCAGEGRIEGHHWDYGKPLMLVWMCPPCHGRAHRGVLSG